MTSVGMSLMDLFHDLWRIEAIVLLSILRSRYAMVVLCDVVVWMCPEGCTRYDALAAAERMNRSVLLADE